MPFIGGEGKRKINFRVDLLNAFNHPVFVWNNLGNTPIGMGTFPSELATSELGTTASQQPITIAEYNTWATFNGKPLATTGLNGGVSAGDVLLAQIRENINVTRLPPRAGSNSGALPDSFFHINLPQGFATSNQLSYDITTLNGYKLYRIRGSYDGNFGSLISQPASNARYIQFGLRLIF